MKKQEFFELAKTVIFAFLVALPIRIFIFQPFLVQGISMEPNFKNGDYLIVDEITFRLIQPKRGEVVVFKSPISPETILIKRIVGLPGEEVRISKGKVFINGEMLKEDYLKENTLTFPEQKVTLNDKEYYLLGDNRAFSLDSRNFGPVKREKIIGRVVMKVFEINIFPIPAFSLVKKPNY
jgi:signal peptidase I